MIEDVSLVDERVLIPLKARAFLDLSERRANGEKVDAKQIGKHRGVVFRLVQLLPEVGTLNLADPIRNDIGEFLTRVLNDPDFDYGALNLPILLNDATAILTRYYQLDSSG